MTVIWEKTVHQRLQKEEDEQYRVLLMVLELIRASSDFSIQIL
jgi:hypothetical protein